MVQPTAGTGPPKNLTRLAPLRRSEPTSAGAGGRSDDRRLPAQVSENKEETLIPRGKTQSHLGDSNPGPMLYESIALPLS